MSLQADFLEDFEVVTVETPENLELRLPLAGFGPRFLAQLVDSAILGLVSLIVIVAAIASAAVIIPNSGEAEALLMPIVVMILLLIVVNVGYFMLFEWLWNGQTVGKRLCGIRVVRRGGLPLTIREVLLRNLLRMVDNLPTNGFVGLVSFFASRYQQRLGDLVADTVVVREFSSRAPYPWLGGGARNPLATSQSLLAPRMSYVIQSYFMRAQHLPVPVRLELTQRVIENLGYPAAAMSLREREDYLASLLHAQLAVQQ